MIERMVAPKVVVCGAGLTGCLAAVAAYLDLCLARAAFRCGSSLGKEILTGYLDDTHSIFRGNARRTLQGVNPPGR